MAKITVEFTRSETTANGGFLFQTSEGQQMIFANIGEIQDFVAEVETQENAIRLAIGRLLHQEPNLSPPTWLKAKAFDLEAVSASQTVIR